MAVKSMYRSEDVQILLDVAPNCAYEVIRKLRKELANITIPGTNRKYSEPPRGRIPAKFFCEKYMLDKQECDRILENKTLEKVG